MQTLEGFIIAKKPAKVLVSIICVGLATNFLPPELVFFKWVGTIVTFFAAGMLAAQHAAIWEKGQRVRGPDDKR